MGYDSELPEYRPVVGNPNGQLSGYAANARNNCSLPDMAWDGTNLWVCVKSGSRTTSVWTMVTNTDETYAVTDHGIQSSGTITLNRQQSLIHRLQVAGGIAIAVEGFAVGLYSEMILQLIDGGSASITWPTDTNWIIPGTGIVTTAFGSTGVTLQAAATDFIVLFSPDGTTIYARVVR